MKRQIKKERWEKKIIALVGVFLAFVLIFFQSKSIFGGDGGDLVSAICVGGVPHPPGYPFYTLLGKLLLKIPYFTPAWRVSFLSSLPALITGIIVCLIVAKITKNYLAAILAWLILSFNYLFWLYAEVPEVFSLNNLFLAVLIILTFSLIEDITPKKIYLFFFVLGLSLSHHHFSLWFYPVFLFFIFWYQRKFWLKNLKISLFLKSFLLFLIGLLPYVYVFLSAKNYPPISWDSPVDFKNFWRLFSRADYGTFLSHGGALYVDLKDRLFLVWSFFLILKEYWGLIGIFFLFWGVLFLYQRKRDFFWLIFSLLIWELFFIFYSGFGLSSKSVFGIGVFIRFLLPGILFSSIFIGCGIYFFVLWLADLLRKKRLLVNIQKEVFILLLMLFLFLYPFSLFFKNFKTFYFLRNDFTAENFAKDILDTVPPGGILLLSFDNPLFNVQYLHYCLKERADVSVFHLSLFEKEFFYPNLKKNYPSLDFPEREDKEFLNKFLEKNKSRPVFTNNLNYIKTGVFIPWGLVYRWYSSKKEIPSLDEVFRINKEIWSSYHDPKEGILSFFRPVTLESILDDYYQPSKNLAVLFLESEEYEKAEYFFEIAQRYNNKDPLLLIDFGRALMNRKKCQEAEEKLLKAAEISSSSLPYFYLEKNAKDCFEDEKKAQEFRQLYLKFKRFEEKNLLE